MILSIRREYPLSTGAMNGRKRLLGDVLSVLLMAVGDVDFDARAAGLEGFAEAVAGP